MAMLIDNRRHKWCKIAIHGWKARLASLQEAVNDAAAMMEREAQKEMGEASKASLRGDYVRDKYHAGLAHGWRQAGQMLTRSLRQ